MAHENGSDPEQEGIFTHIVGHSGAKAVLRGALRAGDVDVLLVGPPATGKSLMLKAIEENIPKVVYRDCKRFSAPRLSKTFAADPPIILLDEIDALDSQAFDVLSNPMEHNRVTDDTHSETIDREIRTQVLSAGNSAKRLPDNIKSRFRIVEVGTYNREEAREVAKRALPGQIGWIEDEEDAEYVANVVYESSESTDVRDYRDVAKMADGKDQVEAMAQGIINSEAEIESSPITAEDVAVAREEVGKQRLTDAVKNEQERQNGHEDGEVTAHSGEDGDSHSEDGDGVSKERMEEVDEEMDRHVRDELLKTLSEEKAEARQAE